MELAAYLALYVKMSNRTLINEVAYIIDRPTSAVVRKMNRMRGVMRDKAPYATEDESICIKEMWLDTEEEARQRFFDALLELKADTSIIDYVLDNALEDKPLPIE